MHHGVKFSLSCAKVLLPAIFETRFSYKDVWITVTEYYVLLHNCAISIDIHITVNKFYSVIIFSLPINAVILLLNGLVLILNLYIFSRT